MSQLAGKRVALAGSRKLEEISQIITNKGGVPVIRPSQGTAILDDSKLEDDLRELVGGSYDWFVFTTGIGTDILYRTAEKIGIGEEFVKTIKEAKVAARGYKTVNTLKKLGITPIVRDDDGSTAGLVRSLSAYDLQHSRVALQLHGDPAPRLISFLDEQKADYKEILPYQHIPPNKDILEQLTQEIVSGEVDAVNFTSTPQARFLFSFAREKGLLQEVLTAFSTNVVAVAVGKVTAAALKDEGVERVVFPETERMGSAIVALEKYYSQD
ncbi:uroporphyrinogen-III synthase [Bacillus sp. B15-48]|uniref:uroporphyrinogen-III synthase n=1 Tax=Bacillus sp. B15-48 TaxID=1548601 RepID=UPI00193F9FFA|nr:uroporphyrinogen-III synthase [Bacillus sp. B15-48]MBM4760845.1 uroporphyrinogen-III synthase [Bacillus sp. B15-48]